MQLDTHELLARIARVREELTAIERLLRELGADKAQARKVANMQETLNELEAQLTNVREAKQ